VVVVSRIPSDLLDRTLAALLVRASSLRLSSMGADCRPEVEIRSFLRGVAFVEIPQLTRAGTAQGPTDSLNLLVTANVTHAGYLQYLVHP
jgi:hypothetical protein